MTKAELDSKHLSELHSLAAEAGIPRYRMLSRAELIEKLASGDGEAPKPAARSSRPRQQRRSRSGSGGRDRRPADSSRSQKPKGEPRQSRQPAESQESQPADPQEPQSSAAPTRRRRRRRRPFGRRRSRDLRVHDLLLPPRSGRQVIVQAETREGCTALLREIASELSDAAKGPEPVILLIDPNPDELAEWRRDAPRAEIVAAGQAKHADDALAQAGSRAAGGEDVILLIDSLSRLGEAYGDAATAKEFFDSGQEVGGSGSLTVVAAVQKS